MCVSGCDHRCALSLLSHLCYLLSYVLSLLLSNLISEVIEAGSFHVPFFCQAPQAAVVLVAPSPQSGERPVSEKGEHIQMVWKAEHPDEAFRCLTKC